MSDVFDFDNPDDQKKLFNLEPVALNDPGDESFDSCIEPPEDPDDDTVGPTSVRHPDEDDDDEDDDDDSD